MHARIPYSDLLDLEVGDAASVIEKQDTVLPAFGTVYGVYSNVAGATITRHPVAQGVKLVNRNTEAYVLPSCGALAIVGTSGTGKSLIAQLIASVSGGAVVNWGEPGYSNDPRSLASELSSALHGQSKVIVFDSAKNFSLTLGGGLMTGGLPRSLFTLIGALDEIGRVANKLIVVVVNPLTFPATTAAKAALHRYGEADFRAAATAIITLSDGLDGSTAGVVITWDRPTFFDDHVTFTLSVSSRADGRLRGTFPLPLQVTYGRGSKPGQVNA